jgi:uncharacterized protein
VSLFVDTSGFYALLVRTERHHGAMLEAFRAAAERGRRMVTTNYVIVETSALLQHRIGLAPVRDLEERILPLVSVQWVSGELHRRAVERLFRTDKRKVTLVNVVSFVVMDVEGLTDVMGLDPDFTAEGFRLLP